MAGAQVDGRDRGDILRNKLAPLHVSSVLRPEHTGQAGLPSHRTQPARGGCSYSPALRTVRKNTWQGSGMPAGQWDSDSLGGHPEAERGRGWVAGTHQGSWA